MSTWPNRTFVLVGTLLIAHSFILAFVVTTIGWGGIWYMPLIVRVVAFGTVLAILLSGVAAVSFGSYRFVCRRPRPS